MKKDISNEVIAQNQLRQLEKFYATSKIDDLEENLTLIKEKCVKDLQDYAKEHGKDIYNKQGKYVGTKVEFSPIAIDNMFFKPICPTYTIPLYNAEKLACVFDYYSYLITQVNEIIGDYPSSLAGFCKFAGISMSTLRSYKNNSDDYSMRTVAEKIYDQIGDENITFSQLGRIKEQSTIFKMKTQNEMAEKNQPNINISLKEKINKDEIIDRIKKYSEFTVKDAKIEEK